MLGHKDGYLQKGSKRLDLTCICGLYFLRAKMENEQVHDCAPVMRDDEDVPMRQDGDEDGDVEERPEDAGVDDDEGEDAVATEMRGPDEPTNATRKHQQLTHFPFQAWCEQCVRGRASDPPHRRLGGRVREEIVIQTDYCYMKTRPQDDIITTLVGVDDSVGRCVAICVKRKGARYVLGVKALAAFARSLGQPRLIKQSDGEHSLVELVRQTCDELPRARQQVTPTASKGSNGRVEQANRAVEGMTRTIMQCLETRYHVEVPTGHPVVQWAIRHAAWLWERFQPWPERVLSTVSEEPPKCDVAVCRDRALARSRTSHVETSIQVGIWSVVGEVSGK